MTLLSGKDLKQQIENISNLTADLDDWCEAIANNKVDKLSDIDQMIEDIATIMRNLCHLQISIFEQQKRTKI